MIRYLFSGVPTSSRGSRFLWTPLTPRKYIATIAHMSLLPYTLKEAHAKSPMVGIDGARARTWILRSAVNGAKTKRIVPKHCLTTARAVGQDAEKPQEWHRCVLVRGTCAR